MAQFARPIADTDDGSWASTPFWSKIDEDIGGGGDDSTVASEVVGNNSNTSDLDLEATNTGLTDPAVSTGHILRVLWASSSVRDITGHFELWQGVPDVGSLIAEATVTLIDATEVTTAYTLDGTETDNITNYNDLYFTLWGRGTGGGPDRSLVVDAIELEIPDASSPQTVTGSLLTRSGTFPTGAVNATNTITGSLLSRSPTFPTGAVNPGNVTVTGSLLSRSPDFPTGAVNPGNVTVTGSLLSRSPTFSTGAVNATHTITGLLLARSPDFPTGVVTPGNVTVTGILLTRSPTFPTGVISLASEGAGILTVFAAMI